MGWAAGLSAGVAAGKAGREVYNKRKISKGLSELDADQANREAADTEAGDFDEESGYDRNMEGLTAFTPSEMASKRGGLYTGAGDLEGGQRYEDQATAFRKEERQQAQFDTTNANTLETNRIANERLGLDTTAANTADKVRKFELTQGEAKSARETKQREGMTELNKALISDSANPEEIGKIYTDYGINPEVGNKHVLDFWNINDAQLKRKQEELTRTTAKLSLSGLINMHKTDDTVTPGRHFDYETIDSNIVLSEYDTETGEKVRELAEFGSTSELETSLRGLATGYGTAIESLATQAKTQRATAGESAIEYAKINADLSKVDADLKGNIITQVGNLSKDPMFRSADRKTQEQAISDIYAPAGIDYKGLINAAGDYGLGGDDATKEPPQSVSSLRTGLQKTADEDKAARDTATSINSEAEALIGEFGTSKVMAAMEAGDVDPALRQAVEAAVRRRKQVQSSGGIVGVL
mgnify:FL=1